MFCIFNFVNLSEMIVDRINDNIVVLELDKGQIMTYKFNKIPNIKEGDIIEYDTTAKKFYIDKKKTAVREKKIKKLMDKVFVD